MFWRLFLILWLLMLLVFADRSPAQEPPQFTDEERVIVIDMPVAFQQSAWREWASGRAVPKEVDPEDFQILVEGREQKVVAVGTPSAESEPWHLVVWIDLLALEPAGLRWAATTLGRQAERLTGLGTVEVLLVEEEPRLLLPVDDNPQALEDALSQLALFPEGRHEILDLRNGLAEVLGAEEEDGSKDEGLLTEMVATETRFLQSRQDLLLTWLTREEGRQSGPRALLWVHGGFDLDPTKFYGSSDLASQPSPAHHHRELVRTLASYGWVTLPMVPPEPELLVEGTRIGKWLVRAAPPQYTPPTSEELDRAERDEPTERAGRSLLGRIFLGGVHAKLQEHRDPELAEAYLELGTSRESQGDLEGAEESFRKALYHFAQDPRTASRQAEAMNRLGTVLETRGEARSAREIREHAHRLDPGDSTEDEPVVALVNGAEPFEQAAQATSGWLIRQGATLARALEDLSQRLRLTFQVPETFDDALLPVKVSFQGAHQVLRFPSWSRQSTPPSVRSARLRRLLFEEGGENFLPVRQDGTPRLSALPGFRGDQLELLLELDLGDSLAGPRQIVPRIQLAFSTEEIGVDPLVRPALRLDSEEIQSGLWRYRLPVDPPEDAQRLAVVVEDLLSGVWGGVWLDL